jgi:hypothetical protein
MILINPFATVATKVGLNGAMKIMKKTTAIVVVNPIPQVKPNQYAKNAIINKQNPKP